jgi:hypothetical protein
VAAGQPRQPALAPAGEIELIDRAALAEDIPLQRVYTATIEPGVAPGPRSIPGLALVNGLIGASAITPLLRTTSRNRWRPFE